jgi:heme-degrading monooxygenase HmoA
LEIVGSYVKHFQENVYPQLRRIDGHRGAYVLQRSLGGEAEILVLTLWDSMMAIHTFAGDDPNVAVVEDEAKTFLSHFDMSVKHFEVVLEARS